MKKLFPFVCLLSMALPSCKKTGVTATTAIVKDTAVAPATGFVPHTDTFSGTCAALIGDGGYTDSTSEVGSLCMSYSNDTTVIITGKMINVSSFNGMAGSATFSTFDFNYYLALNRTGVYHFYPQRHNWQNLRMQNDSLCIDFYTSPGNCVITEAQVFRGKKKH